MKKNWKMILGLILAIIVVVFSMMNMESTTVNFGFRTFKQPLIILILISVLIGAVLVALFSSGANLSQKHQIRQLNKELDQTKAGQEQAIQDRIKTLQTNYENLLSEKEDQINQLKQELAQMKEKDTPSE